ncbi:DUF2075 domain-containing protein [Leuconostoc mesenteroides]|uniref:DNA/RNA helicase domain-containing protein n=2 Tax=Leuconostoc mesenteroides TaxID=1245 RepID=UPI0006800562|nr:DNA/RNA helicase domain-containing protein [Leuconostoc mesenteroides]ARR89847.1 ATP-binding protein [Leuconostoc mesenteroides subsp. mesenteroides]KMY79156.1 hypothetical protein WZ81_07965 [Leuconostoc mesenteroides subsp. cremoris]TLP97116.1 DUF2075 domain-containing protein [Leuconostoc mesenteroides]
MRHQKEVSLLELLNVINTNNDNLIHSYLKLHDYEYNFIKNKEQIDIKELTSYKTLLDHLITVLSPAQSLGFHLGFKLKDQANTQFDLLKVANDTVVNIEFKSETPNKKISKQATEHFRFLSMVFSRVIILEHLASTDELWIYDDKSKEMKLISYDKVKKLIPNDSTDLRVLSDLSRSDFLVAPYNEPEKFMKSAYELTSDQKEISHKIVSNATDMSMISKTNHMSMINGGPGSGKTLLLIDIVRELKKRDFSIGMVMGARPSSGQKELMEKLDVSLYWYYNLESLSPLIDKDVLVFDETQRITQNIIDEVKNLASDKILLFSIDENQIVHPDEASRNVQQQLKELIDEKNIYELKKSIRINPELSNFYKRLLNKNDRGVELSNFDNVAIKYFELEKDAEEYITEKRHNGVTAIESDEYITLSYGNKTRSKKYNFSKNTKDVIGQEFKDVLLVFDEFVVYNEEGKLIVTNPNYYPYIDEKMIFQAITRASHSLEIIIIKNKKLYIELQTLLTKTRDSNRQKKNQIHALEEKLKDANKEISNLKLQLDLV